MRSLTSAGILLSLTLALGRVAGLIREMQLSNVFGLSREGDYAIVMLTTPDLLVNLLLAGGLSAALVPEFARLDAIGQARVFGVSSAVVLALFGTIGIMLALFPAALFVAFAPGYVGAPHNAYALPYAIAALAIPLAGLTGVTSALLYAQDRFFIAGAGTLVFNTTIIVVLIMMPEGHQSLLVLAAGLALAALLRYVSQVLAALSYRGRTDGYGQSADYRRLAFRFIQALSANSVVLFVPVILRSVISFNGEGKIAALNFATKLVELPLGLAITTVSTVAFPALSRAFIANDRPEQLRIYASGLQLALRLALCIAIPAIWFTPDLVELVFARGRLSSADLALISDLARLGFLTLPLIAVSSMATTLLNARGQTGLLFKVTFASAFAVPIAALPGLWSTDARLAMSALPVFHLLYAIALVLAAKQPIFAGWDGAWQGLFRPTLTAVAATAVSAFFASFTGTDSAIVGSILALGTMLSAVVATALSCGRRHYRTAMLKRGLDILGAACALIVSMPLWLVIAILIKAYDGGPVFYRQSRTGLGGRKFFMLKFRSMVPDADRIGGYSTLNNDLRITPIGRFVRRASLDELPQIINVLRGDMSFVGPRPDVPKQRLLYSAEEFDKRNSVRPGITGLAQATVRSTATVEERKRLDLDYVDEASFLLDMKIIALTMRQVLATGGN